LRRNDPTAADVDAVERRIAATARQRDTYLTNIGSAPTPDVASLMMGKVAALLEELKGLEAERDAVLNRRRAWESVQSAMRDLQTWCARVAERLEGADYEMKRTALDYLGVRVKVYRPGSQERFVVEAITVTPDGEVVSTITPGRG